jgi:AcrR family transcriptional regulator
MAGEATIGNAVTGSAANEMPAAADQEPAPQEPAPQEVAAQEVAAQEVAAQEAAAQEPASQEPGAGRPGRVRPHRHETRRRVLDAAFAVFGERGIAGTSLSEVAEAAGLTKGAIYSSFRSKDELVLALLEEHARQRLALAVDGFARADDLDDSLVVVGAALARAMHTDAAWHRMLAEYFALSHRDPDRREGLRRRRREARAIVAAALTELAGQHGLVLPLPPDELSVLLFALSNGLAMEAGMDPDAVPDDLFARVLVLLAAARTRS